MMDAPFPYFGGKSKVAPVIWQALGDVRHYMEPFFGSGAVLLNRPNYDPTCHIETVVDKDGHVCNAWRALQADPDAVARVCDWPVNHFDLTARRKRLIAELPALAERLTSDDKYYDIEQAGYWIWAASCWIGSGLTNINAIPHISNGGKCIHRLSNRPHLSWGGSGIHRLSQRPHLSNGGKGVQEAYNTNLYTWFRELSERLRNVRIVGGDWSRVCGGNWQDNMGTVGIFFDPPYSDKAGRDMNLYAEESGTVAHDVRRWCLERGALPKYRIVLAGYMGEHDDDMLAAGWTAYRWKAGGGYANIGNGNGNGNGKTNRHKETLWFSPHCIQASAPQPSMIGLFNE
jgi:DNA adenine methylase